MANIREIAERAGVGIATVSRYINGTGYVSEEARQKIQREIDRSDYTPNALARAIFTKESKIIGLMIPNISNPFFNQITTVIEKHSESMGYSLFLCNTEDSREKEAKYLEMLKSYRVEGIITLRSQCKEEYLNMQTPVVSFENYILPSIPIVASDNYNGGRKAFTHLYERGCKNILHIKGPRIFEATEKRCKGFLDAANEKNLEIDVIEFKSDFRVDMLERSLEGIEDIEKYDGIFVFNDIASAVVMKYLKENEITIPDMVQVIGFDNSFIGQLLHPSLTTINQSIKELGTLTVDLLVKLINGEQIDAKKYFVDTELVQRETTLNLA